MVQLFWEVVWNFFKMLSIELPYVPEGPSLDIDLRERKTVPTQEPVCTQEHYSP